MLKGLLLMRNYDEYRPKLRKIGHNLVAAAKVAAIELKLNPPRGQFLKELVALNAHYGRQFLRYGSMFDLFFDPKKQPTEAFMRKLSAILVLADAKAGEISRSLWTTPSALEENTFR